MTGFGGRAVPVIALLVALLGVTATGLIAQDAPDEPGRLDITVFVVGEHANLDRPLVIVLNPSWAQSHAVISVEADALDASLLERGLRAAERALSSESLAGSEDVILSVALLQGPTGEAHEAQPSAFRDRAQWAVDYLTPRIEQLRASPTGLRGAPGPGMSALGVTGFLESVSMTFHRPAPSGESPQ